MGSIGFEPFAAAALAALAAGLLGPFVLARRATYAAGAISHSMMAGIGLAVFCGEKFGWEWFTPFWGSLFSTAVAAAVLAFATGRGNARADAVLGGIWAGGFATGIVLMVLATGEEADVEEYLIGSIMEIEGESLAQLAALDVLIAVATVAGYSKMLAVSFNRQLAALRGVRAGAWEMAFALATAMAVALIAHTGGVLMSIALLTLPAVAASRFARSMKTQMALAGVLAFAASTAGIAAGALVNPLFASAAAVFVLLIMCAVPRFGCRRAGK